MANEFRLPDIGEGLTEAEVVRWVIDVGGSVAVDETVVEVETDKAVVEIPSPFAGVVLHHGAAEGETIAVGDVLVVIGDAGEAWGEEDAVDADAAAGSAPAEDEASADEPPDIEDQAETHPESVADIETESGIDEEPEAAPIVGTLSEEAEELAARSETASVLTTSVKALPVVRKLARDHGIDIGDIDGSGPEGRITRDDVMALVDAHGEVAPQPPEVPAIPEPPQDTVPAPKAGAPERRRLSRLRRTIADNMSRSWAEIPHVTTFDEVDATRLLDLRAALKQRHEMAIPLEALVITAVVPVLRAFPEFNATLDGDEVVLHRRYDVGVAVDTADGLLVAVIEGADRRSVLGLSEEVRRLGKGAKSRTLGATELTGQTFTVSNIGAVGGGFGTPIVPHGTTAILSVGRAVDSPVARDGRVDVAPVLPLSLSYDHRVIDGGLGRRFMAMLLENLREPGLFLA